MTALGDLMLTPGATETLVVEAQSPLIEPRAATAAAILTSDYFTDLPVERDYRSVATLLPHVNGSTFGDEANYAGSTGLENRYFIDGMETTDPYRGITGSQIPYNFVDELEVKVAGYEAEYRGALGGLLNVVTPPAAQRTSGSVFGFIAGDRFAGGLRQGAIELKRRNYVLSDLGMSIAGPIWRDRVWYFAAYDPNFESADVEIPGLGWFSDKTTRHSVAAKVSWQSTASTVVLNAIGDVTHRRGVGDMLGNFGVPLSFENPDPYLRDIKTGGVGLLLRGTHLIGHRGLMEASVSQGSRHLRNGPGTSREDLLFVDRGIWSGGSPSAADNPSRQLTLGWKLTWLLDRHELKTGTEYRDSSVQVDWTSKALWRYRDDLFLLFLFRNEGTFHNRVPSLFVQDSWLAMEGLRLNLGLRWEKQALVGSNGRVAQHIRGEWQPRLGFVWQPGQLGRERVFGSAARSYHDVALHALSFHFVEGAQQDFCYYDHDPRIESAGATCIVGRSPDIAAELPGLEGQYSDEITLGYDRRIGALHKVGVRGIFRTLRRGLENGWSAALDRFVWGNPGYGPLHEYPAARRDYRALELTLERPGEGPVRYLVSYVWSATTGNYPGLYNSDFDYAFPNANASFDFPEMLVYGDGPLPNDRTHVLKLSGSRRWAFGLTVGSVFSWASGTPLSEFGGTARGAPFWGFVHRRGSAGRTPAVFDLNARLAWRVPLGIGRAQRPRLLLDFFHLFSQRNPVDYDQLHYFNLDSTGRQIDLNPTYGTPTRYQPPMSVRFGLEMTF